MHYFGNHNFSHFIAIIIQFLFLNNISIIIYDSTVPHDIRKDSNY